MKYLHIATILEARYDAEHADYEVDSKTGKVIATLKSYDSARYTKLGKDLERINELQAEITKLQAQTKAEIKEYVAGLFDAEDVAFTRVVETVSFVFQLTKDPKATEAPQYSKILTELEAHLTPSLIKVLEGLKKKHVTVTQKSPALSFSRKDVTEGVSDVWASITTALNKLATSVHDWGARYDHSLDKLKHAAGL